MADPAVSVAHVEQRFRRRLVGGIFLVLVVGGLAQRNQRALFVPMERGQPSDTAFAFTAIPYGGPYSYGGWGSPDTPGRRSYRTPGIPGVPGTGVPGDAPGVPVTSPGPPSAFLAVPGNGGEPGSGYVPGDSPGSDGGFDYGEIPIDGPVFFGGGGGGASSPGGGGGGVVPGAVPEPASWLMMILGIGAVGAALRRRRALADAAAATAG